MGQWDAEQSGQPAGGGWDSRSLPCPFAGTGKNFEFSLQVVEFCFPEVWHLNRVVLHGHGRVNPAGVSPSAEVMVMEVMVMGSGLTLDCAGCSPGGLGSFGFTAAAALSPAPRPPPPGAGLRPPFVGGGVASDRDPRISICVFY